MIKFTVTMFPEHEWLVLESIGKTGVAHLSEVTEPEFKRLAETSKREIKYSELSKKFSELSHKYLEYVKSAGLPRQELSMDDLKKLAEGSESMIEEFVAELEQVEKKLGEMKMGLEKLGERDKEQEDAMKDLESKYISLLGKVASIDHVLKTFSDEGVPILRLKELTIIQGWVPEDKLPILKQELDNVDKQTGEQLLVHFERPTPEEKMPTNLTVQPNFFNPAITLTKLRGIPSAHEINPTLVTIITFSFQFGMMFGDVGQGLLFLILGFLLPKKFKTGLAPKLGVMFVPMGIFSIIFGFLYGEVFLIEGIIHPLLLSPLHNIGMLMKIVLGIAVLEMCSGLVLGAINQYKEGNVIGVIGEHGIGGIFFLVGLYFGALYFLEVGDFMALTAHWSFYTIISGLMMAFVEPILSNVMKRKKISFEVVGEGFAAFIMTFIENLSNFFSFLRIAAFALAHACLAVAAEALIETMGVGSIVLMNVIAMSFEFVSSCVQSLRLLYYEFMSKFFHGGGTLYKPFILKGKR